MFMVYELGKQIFDKTFPVYAKQLEIEGLIDDYEEPSIISLIADGQEDMNGIVYSRQCETDNMVIRMMAGRMRLSGDDEQDDTQLKRLVNHAYTPNEMVEVWEKSRALRFANAKDVVTVYNLLSDYLTEIQNYRRNSLNYREPPQEDLVKIRALLDDMKERADGLSVVHDGEDPWSSIESLFQLSDFTFDDSGQASYNTENRNTKDVIAMGTNDPFGFLVR